MYTPHTVSLINDHNHTPHLTILRGVMLQALNGRSVQRRGALEEANAVLFIPLAVQAVGESGEEACFLPPREYASCTDPEKNWTLQPEGESAGRSSFYVKGELAKAISLAEARESCDEVYVVAGWRLCDYGSPGLRHMEVHSRVSSRYYQYGG